MGGAFRGVAGGILSLLDLPREYWEALESDLLRSGFTLSDIPHKVTWRAIKARFEYASQGDALYQALHGDAAKWSDQEHLTAILVDLASLLVWFKTEDGQKNKNRPKRIPRPGVEEAEQGVSIGSGGVPVEEFADAWAAAVQRQLEADSAETE